jgi:carbonic anhydrase
VPHLSFTRILPWYTDVLISFPLEVHFVHTAVTGTGQIVVVSLLVDAGDTPSKLLALFDGYVLRSIN